MSDLNNLVTLRRPVHLSSFHYKDYLMKKYLYDGAVEEPHGFLLYRIVGEECIIGDIYVEAEKRQLGIAAELADKCTEIARANGCKILSCQTQITGGDDHLSMLAILHYGFKPITANNNVVIYVKEIQ